VTSSPISGRADEAVGDQGPAGATVDVPLPQMGVSVAEGTVVEWRKGPGDAIAADETICEVSTDKIDTEVPAPVGGVVAAVLVAVGETVTVGTVLARIAVEGGGGTVAPPGTPDEAEAALDPPSDTAAPKPDGNGAGPARHYSPVVVRIAQEHGIDLATVKGTGRGGRVRKPDVLALVGSPTEPPLHIESPYRPEPEPEPAESLSRMRRSIGEHMKRSLDTAATCTTWMEVDMSAIETARERTQTTALPWVAGCAVAALREHPALNAWLEGDRHTVHRDAVHLGIAVSLGEDGLVVPVIRDAHELSPEGLAARIRDVARRARAGDLSPDDVRGGTFTITNPGQYGSLMATPVIHQPQVAILDLEAIVKRPVVVAGDAIAVRPMTILGLSWDHRALDGVLAARFLGGLKERMEAVR
jgi:pyruvate/2-oxoglutarate dehydrogenase complex dihydrolipoamide acyltransferase (E2) component